MIEAIVTSLVVAALGACAKTLWSNRRNLGLLRLLVRPMARMRVSVAVLLRLQDEDSYVLFDSPVRPGAFGPPGGVVKYQDDARKTLEGLGFNAEPRSSEIMRYDLRGFLPARRVPAFARWLHRGDGRESPAECLRRELVEELGEVGHPQLAALVGAVAFTRVRAVIDGPLRVPGESYRQIRFIEIYDLLLDKPEATRLKTELLSLAKDPSEAHVARAGHQDIARGRAGAHVVAPQSAFLLGDRRLRQDLQPAS
jgi:hypothetical protein